MRKWWTYHQYWENKTTWLSYKDAAEWEGPFLYHHLTGATCQPALLPHRARGAHEMSSSDTSRTPPLEPSAAFPVPLPPHLHNTPNTVCWRRSKPQLHYRHGHSSHGCWEESACPEKDMKFKVNQKSSWQRLESGREKKTTFTSHLNHSHEGWNFPNWRFLETLTTAPQTGRWRVSKLNPGGGHKRSKPQPVCISFNEIVSVTPGCKRGSDWEPDYGYFLNMDFIFFLLNFMCSEAEQANSQISKNQHTRACPFPQSLRRLRRKMRKSANQKAPSLQRRYQQPLLWFSFL